jgi:hypothetical protein
MSRVKVQARPKRRAGTNLEEAVYHRTGETGGYLNPRWIELAHGLPIWMVSPALHALGNAVVPAVAEHIGRLIVADHEWRTEAAA